MLMAHEITHTAIRQPAASRFVVCPVQGGRVVLAERLEGDNGPSLPIATRKPLQYQLVVMLRCSIVTPA